MFARNLLLLLASGGFSLALLEPTLGRTDEPGRVPNAPEALSRGPVHEAFAQPSESPAQPPGPILREPPALIDEQPPDQKPEGSVVWVPGYWQWDQDRSDFVWVSGFWRVPPPGRQWTPGSYQKVEGGYQWVPGSWSPEDQSQLNVLPPPPASVENGPSQPAPAEDSIYVPGNWVYRDTRYLWRPGHFIAYRPGFVWVPAHYVPTPAGFVFVGGYWDYPLARRGLLFAPVVFGAGVVGQPDFVYTPSYVVSADFLPTALFVRPGYGHYYFGDYDGPTCTRTGYVPWIDFCLYRNCPDPLFVQARIGFGGAAWERNVRTVYAQRARGGLHVGAARNVSAIAPLTQVARQGVPLTSVSVNERVRYRQNSVEIRQRGFERRDLQTQLITSRSAPLRASDPPRTINLSVPRAAVTTPPVRPQVGPLPADHHVPHRIDQGSLPVRETPRGLPRLDRGPALPAVGNAAPAIRHDSAPPPVIRHEAPVIRREMHTPPAPPPSVIDHGSLPVREIPRGLPRRDVAPALPPVGNAAPVIRHNPPPTPVIRPEMHAPPAPRPAPPPPPVSRSAPPPPARQPAPAPKPAHVKPHKP